MNVGKMRYFPWLVVFLVALLTIPGLVYLKQLMLAKWVGIGVTVTLVMMLRVWLYRLKKGSVQRYAITTNDIFLIESLIPRYRHLSQANRRAFEHRIGLIMASLTVLNPENESLNIPANNLAILGACYAFLHFDDPKGIQWIIQTPSGGIENQKMLVSIDHVTSYLQGIELRALENRLLA